MSENFKSLKVDDFFEKLQHDKLDTNSSLFLIGMVKKSEWKEKTIEFAIGGNCSDWVTIPLEFIDDVEVMKTISCKDHSHPLVKINMKTPQSSEGKIFFALLYSMNEKFNGSSNYTSTAPENPTSLARLASGGFGGGFGGGASMNNLCVWTYKERWVCTTVTNKDGSTTTSCGWVGGMECIPQ